MARRVLFWGVFERGGGNALQRWPGVDVLHPRTTLSTSAVPPSGFSGELTNRTRRRLNGRDLARGRLRPRQRVRPPRLPQPPCRPPCRCPFRRSSRRVRSRRRRHTPAGRATWTQSSTTPRRTKSRRQTPRVSHDRGRRRSGRTGSSRSGRPTRRPERPRGCSLATCACAKRPFRSPARARTRTFKDPTLPDA